MNAKINQLCKTIAEHPSQINLLNQALSLALAPPTLAHIAIVLDLITKLTTQAQIRSFLTAKLKAIFITLLTLSEDESDSQLFEMMSKTFDLSENKSELCDLVLVHLLQNEVDWTKPWPGQVVAGVCEKMVQKLEEKEINWKKYIDLLLGLPSLSEMVLTPESQQSLKKNFQRLMLGVLASETIPQPLLHELYHGLSSKVIQKMAQPLSLANHCLACFKQTKAPQLQIQILSSLFLLVGKHGLELEQFYEQLQVLIQSRKGGKSVYELPNSRRFFKLLEASLRSSRVPFKTITTFAVMLARQLSGESPEFAYWALSFLINLTKKHRKLLDELPQLPEIKALRYHHSSKIRTLVGQLSKNLNQTDYLDIADFTNLSLESLARSKLDSALQTLSDESLQFRLPAFQEPL